MRNIQAYAVTNVAINVGSPVKGFEYFIKFNGHNTYAAVCYPYSGGFFVRIQVAGYTLVAGKLEGIADDIV